MSFNFLAAVTVRSDFGAQEIKICHCFHFSTSICHEVLGLGAIILVFLILDEVSNWKGDRQAEPKQRSVEWKMGTTRSGKGFKLKMGNETSRRFWILVHCCRDAWHDWATGLNWIALAVKPGQTACMPPRKPSFCFWHWNSTHSAGTAIKLPPPQICLFGSSHFPGWKLSLFPWTSIACWYLHLHNCVPVFPMFHRQSGWLAVIYAKEVFRKYMLDGYYSENKIHNLGSFWVWFLSCKGSCRWSQHQ